MTGPGNLHDGATGTRRAWRESGVSIYSIYQGLAMDRSNGSAILKSQERVLTTLGLRLGHLNGRSGNCSWRHV